MGISKKRPFYLVQRDAFWIVLNNKAYWQSEILAKSRGFSSFTDVKSRLEGASWSIEHGTRSLQMTGEECSVNCITTRLEKCCWGNGNVFFSKLGDRANACIFYYEFKSS